VVRVGRQRRGRGVALGGCDALQGQDPARRRRQAGLLRDGRLDAGGERDDPVERRDLDRRPEHGEDGVRHRGNRGKDAGLVDGLLPRREMEGHRVTYFPPRREMPTALAPRIMAMARASRWASLSAGSARAAATAAAIIGATSVMMRWIFA